VVVSGVKNQIPSAAFTASRALKPPPALETQYPDFRNGTSEKSKF
jgi:hypothetical protein